MIARVVLIVFVFMVFLKADSDRYYMEYIDGKRYLLSFKKPDNTGYSTVKVKKLSKKHSDRVLGIDIEFTKFTTMNSPDKMQYKTTLKRVSEDTFENSFRLIYEGKWKYTLRIDKARGKLFKEDIFEFSYIDGS